MITIDPEKVNLQKNHTNIHLFVICICKLYIISVTNYIFRAISYQTFFKFWDEECAAMSSFHFRLHLGHSLLISLYRCIMDCKIAENGVTPIPVAINTACSARKMLLAGAPNGPSIKILKNKMVLIKYL